MRLTTKIIEKHIRANRDNVPADFEVVRGNGYQYMLGTFGGEWISNMIFVCYLNHMDISGYLAEYDSMKEDAGAL